jgi:hypothetical protein
MQALDVGIEQGNHFSICVAGPSDYDIHTSVLSRPDNRGKGSDRELWLREAIFVIARALAMLISGAGAS